MRKKLYFFLLMIISIQMYAQNQTNTITGKIFDGVTKEPVLSASVRILSAKDSTYVNGTVTNDKGQFSINVNNGRYIAEISFLGYATQYFDVSTRKGNLALGDVFLKEGGILLGEATVTAKAVEILVKGDTIEYNADSYKTQESAVLEDLIKKIPGAEVDKDGKITINGKEISKVLVDGKEFFSDDPKVASKNLPAKMIEKLQVLDRKSDMSLMTGFDDGNEETVINLTVKPGMKEGLFGNAMGGYGSKDRYEGSAMVNYMRDNTQMTGLGGINNTNNAGFTDFASGMLGQGGPPRGVRFGANNGVAKTVNGGFNFATEQKNILKWGGNVRYGSTDNDVSTTRDKQYTGLNRTEATTSFGNNKSDNLGANLRFEWKPDSMTTIIFQPNVQYNQNRNNQSSSTITNDLDNPLLSTSENSKYFSDGSGLKLNGELNISRKLNNKGRIVSLGVTGSANDSHTDGDNYSLIKYTSDPSKADSILDQRFNQKDNSYTLSALVSYVEPLGRNNFMQLTYDISNTHSETDKRAFANDGSGNYTTIVEASTRNVKNDFLKQRISLNFKSVREKYNYTIGMGVEPSSSKTTITDPSQLGNDIPRKSYFNFAPNGQFNYMWDKRHNLRIDYKGTTNQATTLQLYDGVISQSGLNETWGNPNLKPSYQNRLSIRYHNFKPEQSSAFMIFGRFTHTLNDIVSVSSRNSVGGMNTTYTNVNGNVNGSLRVIYNTPLRNQKFTFNAMTFGSYARSNSFVDSEKNTANVYKFEENMGMQFKSSLVDAGLRGKFGYSKSKNTLNTKNDQSVFDYGGYANLTFYLPYDFNVDTDMDYTTNSGYSDGYKLNQWLWNASISKQFLKAKNATLRIKIYDILKERTNVSRQYNTLYIEDVATNTINSYFMVSLVYRFQVFKGGAKAADMMDGGRGFGGRGPGGPPR